ncbi:MAG TPA: hypothetical protein VE522_06610 [Actinomycetota bacterium]|nr:hypothetical protein [Actinomycetota bacterium]
MFANVKATLLRPLRRLRAFMLSDAWSIGTEARDLARAARDVASDARTAASETASRLDATMDWVADEIRKGRVYGGLGQLLDRYPSLQEHIGLSESRVFSQNGEDGVLRFLLERLGVATGSFVEIGAERQEANCLLLAMHQAWTGVFVDGDPDVAANLTELLRHTADVRVVNEMVDPATVDAAMERWGVPADIDVLSIDVDGPDYYIWEALRRVRPRIVVIEYNAALDPDRALVQLPSTSAWDGTVNFGCSFGALRRLAEEKGYAPVYLESSGTNAFFAAVEHLAELGPLPVVRHRAPNYHLRPDGRHPGTVDESRFVELEK